MDLALISALIGSLCLGLMVVFDRLMMSDCYQNKSDHAWFISSSAGASFGLIATAITWLGYSHLSGTTFTELASNSLDLFLPYGACMLVVGIINIQVMRHYFRLFIPDKYNRVNETAIAMWLAAVPIFIFISLFILKSITLEFGIFLGLEAVNISIAFGASVILAVSAMIWFEYSNSGKEAFRLERMGEITKMIGCIVFYTILSSTILRNSEASIDTTIALQPYYWIGFAAGARTMLRKENRQIFASHWRVIKKYFIPIIVVEVIGMFVYFFEFFALSGADPTLVNLIIGAHIIPVFVLSLWLIHLRERMQHNQTNQEWHWGLSFSREKLPQDRPTRAQLASFVAVVITILVAIALS